MSHVSQFQFWNQQLNLKGYEVVSERRGRPNDPVRLTLASTFPIGLCPHCSRATDQIHRRIDTDPIRDLPHGTQQVELIFRTAQFHCLHCDRYFTPPCLHIAPGAHATERFLEQAAKLIRFADIANVAGYLGVPEKSLARWYYDYVERQRQKPPTESLRPIKSLGIDELSQKKVPTVRGGDYRSHQSTGAGDSGGSR